MTKQKPNTPMILAVVIIVAILVFGGAVISTFSGAWSGLKDWITNGWDWFDTSSNQTTSDRQLTANSPFKMVIQYADGGEKTFDFTGLYILPLTLFDDYGEVLTVTLKAFINAQVSSSIKVNSWTATGSISVLLIHDLATPKTYTVSAESVSKTGATLNNNEPVEVWSKTWTAGQVENWIETKISFDPQYPPDVHLRFETSGINVNAVWEDGAQTTVQSGSASLNWYFDYFPRILSISVTFSTQTEVNPYP